MKSKVKHAAIDLAARIRARFADLGGVDLVIPKRERVRAPPSLDGGSNAPRSARRVTRKP